MKRLCLTLFCIAHSLLNTAQTELPLGSWKDHLSYSQLLYLAEGENEMIYAAGNSGMIAFNKIENSFERISKINRLTDVGISALQYDFINHFLIVGYENGNLDLLRPDGTTINIVDIKISSIIGDKRIYSILPYNDRIYLATGLGIVVIDPIRLEVKETYIIGVNGSRAKVSDILIHDNIIYAALPDGVLQTSLSNTVLADYSNWSYMNGFPNAGDGVSSLALVDNKLVAEIEFENRDDLYYSTLGSDTWTPFLSFDGLKINQIHTFNNQLWCAGIYSTIVYDENLSNPQETFSFQNVPVRPWDVWLDSDGEQWITDDSRGLLRKNTSNGESVILPNGPRSNLNRRITAYNNNLWLAPGGVTSFFGNSFRNQPAEYNLDGTWNTMTSTNGENSLEGILDVLSIAVDPQDNSKVYAASFEEGLIEISGNQIAEIFNAGNSTLRNAPFPWIDDWVGVSGVSFDQDANLWISNANTPFALHVKEKESGQFFGYNLSPALTSDDVVIDVYAARSGFVWLMVEGRGLIGYNPNGTLNASSDDTFRLLIDEEGSGNLPGKDVYCVAEDLEGELWIGGLQGLTVLYNQDAVFNSENFDAETIKIQQGGNTQELLATEAITSIEIDGGNRKWISTQNSGVFLFSPDGQQEILHFTSENSPLYSNNVLDIAINQANGEVFFVTDQGMQSYFGDATNFDNEMKDVFAYPNPVQADFTGDIVIQGLAYNSIVKITDLRGNLVSEFPSEGGRAIWNGKNLAGEKPATGVYLIFSASEDGSADHVGKIAFIR